jgi:2-oxoglutarate dehydrogenase E2 component (dihydrolipoamide succinyltransferase)
MPSKITVPELGESVTEATVGRWLRQPGDAVAAGDPLVELETEKVTMELVAAVTGTLESIVKSEGQTVGIGDLLGTIGTE